MVAFSILGDSAKITNFQGDSFHQRECREFSSRAARLLQVIIDRFGYNHEGQPLVRGWIPLDHHQCE